MEHALVVRTGALGDFVATLPVLARLREEARRLTVVAPARYRVLFAGADAWHDADSAHATAMIAGRVDLSGVDLGVAWTSTAAEALTACGARAVAAGTPRPPPGTSIHDHLWAPLRDRFGPRDRDPRLTADPTAVAAITLRLGDRRPVVISPGSGGAAKRWPLPRWRAVAERLDDVVWIGGPIEADEPGWGSPRWDDLDLVGLVALATRCRAWLCPDSGPGHLAAAAGARTGVVFTGATDPTCWAPPGAAVFGADDEAAIARFAGRADLTARR